VYETCQRFLRGRALGRLRAASALVDAVTEIPETVSDPGVALVKLKWWRDAVNEAVDTGQHQHPVIQALIETGLLGNWDRQAWEQGIVALGMRCDSGPFSSQSELMDWCRLSSGMIESAFVGGAEPQQVAGMANALLLWLEAWVVQGGSPGWLPLDLLARHGEVRATGKERHSLPDAQVDITRNLAATALERWRTLGPVEASADHDSITAAFALRDHVVQGRLAMLAKSPDTVAKRGGAPTFGETWSTWRAARRLAAKLAP